MLDSIYPLTFVARAISPLHFSVAVALIILVTAVVEVAGLPGKGTDSTLFIISIVSLKLVAGGSLCLFAPLAFAMLHATLELTHVNTGVLPLVLAEAMRSSLSVLSLIGITICKQISPLPMLQTHLPFTFVSISVFPLVNAIAISFALKPLADVGISKNTFPHALAFFESIFPLAFIDFTVKPCVDTFSVWLIVLKFSFEFVTV